LSTKPSKNTSSVIRARNGEHGCLAQSSQESYAQASHDQWGGPLSQDHYDEGPLSLSFGIDPNIVSHYAQIANWPHPIMPKRLDQDNVPGPSRTHEEECTSSSLNMWNALISQRESTHNTYNPLASDDGLDLEQLYMEE